MINKRDVNYYTRRFAWKGSIRIWLSSYIMNIVALGERMRIIEMRKLTIMLIISIAFLASFSQTSFAGDTYTTGFGFVSGNIQYDKHGSCKKEYPLHVQFNNRSVRTVAKITFSVLARYPDRSTNLINDASKWDDWSSHWTSDRIIERFDEVGMCFRLPTLSENANPEQLVWEIKITNVGWK